MPTPQQMNATTVGVLSTSLNNIYDPNVVLYNNGLPYATGAFRAVQPSDSIQVVSTPTNYTVSGVDGVMTTGIALQANPNRSQTYIQNLGTGSSLFVKFGIGASAQSFSFVLKPDVATFTSISGGQGGIWNYNGFFQGPISVSGRTAFICWDA